jgi:hypothetical protein
MKYIYFNGIVGKKGHICTYFDLLFIISIYLKARKPVILIFDKLNNEIKIEQ